jgi:two-component system CitB family sensor kinase
VLAALLLGKVTQARERGIELTVGDTTAVRDLPLAVTDAVTLVGNLIDNAMEAVAMEPPTATLEAGPATVEAAASGAPATTKAARQVWVEMWDDNAGLSVRVSDAGPGVPAGQAGEIFTRGYTTKDAPGRGLGLALVDQIVKRNQGTITVSAREEGGAVFEVGIPRARR